MTKEDYDMLREAIRGGSADAIEAVLIQQSPSITELCWPRVKTLLGDEEGVLLVQEAFLAIRAQGKWPDKAFIEPLPDGSNGIHAIISQGLNPYNASPEKDRKAVALLSNTLAEYHEAKPEELRDALRSPHAPLRGKDALPGTVLHIDRVMNDLYLTNLLMDYGADPSIPDQDGRLAADSRPGGGYRLIYALHNEAWSAWVRQEMPEPFGTDNADRSLTRLDDMLSEVADRVLLPELMLQLKWEHAPEMLEDTARPGLCDDLRQMAAKALLKDIGPEAAFALCDRWHEHATIPESLLPILAGREWKPLHDPFAASNGLTILPLTSDHQLREESKRLSHCVGNARYGTECAAEGENQGLTHILSVRDAEGNSLSTVEVKVSISLLNKPAEYGNTTAYIRGKDYLLHIRQHHGRNDVAPPAESITAIEEWKKALETGKLVPHLSSYTAKKTELGPLPRQGEEPHDIYQIIGYVPSEEHVTKVLHALGQNVRVVTHERGSGNPLWRKADKASHQILVDPGKVTSLRSLIHGEGTSNRFQGVQFPEGKDGTPYIEMTAAEYLRAKGMDLVPIIEKYFGFKPKLLDPAEVQTRTASPRGEGRGA